MADTLICITLDKGTLPSATRGDGEFGGVLCPSERRMSNAYGISVLFRNRGSEKFNGFSIGLVEFINKLGLIRGVSAQEWSSNPVAIIR